jgi:hypothetical protein
LPAYYNRWSDPSRDKSPHGRRFAGFRVAACIRTGRNASARMR